MIWARLQRFQEHTRMGGFMEWKKNSWTQSGGSIQNKKTVTYEMEDSFQNQGSSDNSGMLTEPCVLYMIIHFKHLIISFLYLDLNHTQKISSVFGGPLIKCNFSSTKGKRVFKSIMPSLTSISFFQYTHGYLTGITRKKFIVIFFFLKVLSIRKK